MTQGETLAELEENIKDAYMMMVMDDVPGEIRDEKDCRMKSKEFIRKLEKDGCIFLRGCGKA